MSFIFADGITRNLELGAVLNVSADVKQEFGSSGFPYTEDNRWVYIGHTGDERLPIIVSPTAETYAKIASDVPNGTAQLHESGGYLGDTIRTVSGGTIGTMDPRFYYIHSKYAQPLGEVLPINVETLGGIMKRCSHCGKMSFDCIQADTKIFCPECVPLKTFVCSECGEIHDVRRRMRGTLELCRPCFETHFDKYRRAEDGCVYLRDSLVRIGPEDSPRYLTPAFAETNTFFCEKCGERHLISESASVYGHRYCYTCADEHYPKCSHCGRRHVKANTEVIEDRNVCRSCKQRHYAECHFCGSYHLLTDLVMSLDTFKRACPACRSAHFHNCHICGRWYELRELTRVPYDGGYLTVNYPVCDDCLSNLERCEDCGVYMRRNYSREGGHKKYCRKCYGLHYFSCSFCGRSISIDDDDVFYGDGDNRICEHCFITSDHGQLNLDDARGVEWDAPVGIQYYSYKPDAILFPSKDNTGLFYGIELETDRHTSGWNYPNHVADKVNSILGFTYAKSDGSLGWDGIEFVSHPATMDYYMEKMPAIREAMEYLRSEGYQSHSGGNCGLHVHVSSFPLMYETSDGIEKLIYLWDKFWNNIVRCSRRGDADGGRWAHRIRGLSDYCADSVIAELEHLKDVKKDSKNSGRYQCINLQNEHTVEFRLMRGTLDPSTFIASLQLISTIVEIVMKKTYEEIRELTWDDILAWHKYPELTKLWNTHKDVSITRSGNLDIDIDYGELTESEPEIALAV